MPTPLPNNSDDSKYMVLNFCEALGHAIDGDRVTRLEWNDRNLYILIYDGKLCIHENDNLNHPLIVKDGDILAEDWVVI